MAGFLEIKYGGRIRYNATAAAGQTWQRGQAVTVNSSGQLALVSASNWNQFALTGPALEQCVATTTGNPMNNSSTVIAGQKASMLLSESVVVTDNLSGYGGWIPGKHKVYADTNGNYTYTSTSGIQVGTALSDAASNGRLTFLYRPNVGN